jgi:hypothetical protein
MMAKSISNKKQSTNPSPEFFMPAMPPLELIDWFEKKTHQLLTSIKYKKLRKKPKPELSP